MRKTLEDYPNLVKEFDLKKNVPLTPKDFTYASNKNVWWKCIKGHEWKTTINNRTHGTNCPYCSGKKVSKENNLKFLFPDIAKEWHPTKNNKLKPEDVTKGSHKKIWWLCPERHEYKTNIFHRTTGHNCPYCSGNKVSKENNLKFLFPDITKEWHPTKNNKLKPEDVTKHSGKKVWWKCIKGHEWEATIINRSRGTNCPKCSFQSSKPEFRILSELETIFKKVDSRHKFKKTEIDIFIKDINVGIEYDGSYYHKDKIIKDKNKNIFLKKYIKKLIRVRTKPLKKLSNLDVIVKYDELKKTDLNNIVNSIYNFCNYKQKVLIKNYLKLTSFVNEKSYKKYLSYFPSPVPNKSLASLGDKFIKEWNYKKNYPLTPESFSKSSNTIVWWKCTKKHEWKTPINNRTNGRNCPYCSNYKVGKDNNLKFSFPEIAKEWHPTKNNKLKPEEVTNRSGKKVWWKCNIGHEWEKKISQRTEGNKCPTCNSFKFLFPNITKEWHPRKNNKLKPEDVTKHSGKRVWWLCLKGHEWKTSVNNRSRGTNCPHC